MNNDNPTTIIFAFLDPNGDYDADGLLNVWETEGYDSNKDGRIDLNLSSLGSNPEHKDIFVEIDYMENHRPYGSAIEVVERAFNDAPLSNPDGYDGINLHLFVDEQIPEILNISKSEINSIKNNKIGSPIDRADPNHEGIIKAKRDIFHYGLFAHTIRENPGASGYSPTTPGMEFIVSLGNPGWGLDWITGHTIGSVDEQAGSLMHEMGHNLGLFHGGNDSKTNKANYLSVMNTNFQFADNVVDRPYDYSRLPQIPINESSIFEPFGIGMTSPPGLITYISCPRPPHEASTLNFLTGTAIDFNGDGDFTDGSTPGSADGSLLAVDLNCDTRYDLLTGQNDWAKLVYIINIPISTPISGFPIIGNMSSINNNLTYSIAVNDPMNERTIYDVKKDRLAKMFGILDIIKNLTTPVLELNLSDTIARNDTLPVSEISNLNQTLISLLNSNSPYDLGNAIDNLTKIRSQIQSSNLSFHDSIEEPAISDVLNRLDTFIRGLELQK